MSAGIVRVLLVDDNENVRRCMRKLLRSHADIEIVSEAMDGAEAASKAREHRPDLVRMDALCPRRMA